MAGWVNNTSKRDHRQTMAQWRSRGQQGMMDLCDSGGWAIN